MNNRGQGAMEYLMTYGWAILVVIIVGIVLWQSGVFAPAVSGVTGFDKIRVLDYSFTTDTLIVVYQNAAGSIMKSVDITYSDDCDGASDFAGTTSWVPGKDYSDTPTACSANCTTGSGFDVDVSVTYTTRFDVNHTESGTIRGLCG